MSKKPHQKKPQKAQRMKGEDDQTTALLEQGSLLLEKGDYVLAEACLKQAIERYPDNADTYHLLSFVVHKVGHAPLLDSAAGEYSLQPFHGGYLR